MVQIAAPQSLHPLLKARISLCETELVTDKLIVTLPVYFVWQNYQKMNFY